jgi:KaiC/GvpD/RAD55 family RecA-like ATPase
MINVDTTNILPEAQAGKKFPAWLEKMQKAGPPISTTVKGLDNVLGGFRGVTIIGGAPSCGKTGFVIQVAQQYAKEGGPVIFLSYEQGPGGFFSRLFQRETGREIKDMIDILQGENGEEIAAKLKEEINQMKTLRLFGLPAKGEEEQQIKAVKDAIKTMQEATKKTALLVVDSLHYVPLGKDSAGLDGKRAIDAALEMFTGIEQATGAAVLMISHQTKVEAKKGSAGLMDFSGSATISFACDIAMIISETEPLKDSPAVLISIPKNRFGRKAEGKKAVTVKYNKSFQKFS